MQALAHFLVRRSTAWATVGVVLCLSLASLFFASRVKRDDDVLAFLPRQNPEVGVFYDVSKRFGSLDTALVGIASDDVFATDFIERLRALTKRLNEIDGVGHAMSLTNVDDFTLDPQKGGINSDYLVSGSLATAEERAALREKVLSRDSVVGNLVAADGKAVMIYCFAGPGAEPKVLAGKVRAAVEEAFPSEPKYWGGAPFISTYIYDVTQKDMRRLGPFAVAAIVIITLLAFWDVIGAGLALLSTAIGIVMSVGLMGMASVPVDVVLSSMPIILFALGSAYAVHVLSHYYATEGEDREAALVRALAEIGPPTIASGVTTAAALLSFVLMDIGPLRWFGVFASIGILLTLTLSLTFVPAVISLARLKGKPVGKGGLARAHVSLASLAALTSLAQKRKLLVGIPLAAVAVAGAMFVGKIDSRMDNAAFFSKNSPPDQAEVFLRDHFGGSLFVQIQVEGDMTEPVVLREIQGLADEVALLPEVSSVNHLGLVIAQINEAMEGDRRIPDTAAKVKLLYGFLEGKKAVSQLVTDDRHHALMQIKLATSRAAETEPVLAAIQKITSTRTLAHYAVEPAEGARKDEAGERARALVASRVRAIVRQWGVALPAEIDLDKQLRERAAVDAEGAIRASLVSFLGSEENMVELPSPAMSEKVAASLAKLGPKPDAAALLAAIGLALDKPTSDALVADLADAIDGPLAEIRKRSEALARSRRLLADAKVNTPSGAKGERFVGAIAGALLDLDAPDVALAPKEGEAGQDLRVSVTGLPVMHAGLSKSVAANQQKSLIFAMGFVLLILTAFLRSFWSGLLGVLPILLTFSIIYGGMGLLGIRLDVGTSMLSSLIIGAGVDYAVHMMVAWSAPPGAKLEAAAATAAKRAGPAIGLSAMMAASGFFVLTLGEARPLQSVGGLTAAAMLTVALATLVVIPLLARKPRYYGAARIPAALPSSEDAVLDTSTPSLSERGSR